MHSPSNPDPRNQSSQEGVNQSSPTPLDELSLGDLEQTPLSTLSEPFGARLARVMVRRHTILISLCVLILWAILAMPPLWHQDEYRRGARAPHDILAPHDAYLFDPVETERRQQAAADSVPPTYVSYPAAQEQALSRLRSIMDSVRMNVVANIAPSSAAFYPAVPPTRASRRDSRMRTPRSPLSKPEEQALRAAIQRFRGGINENGRAEPIADSLVAQLLVMPASRLNAIERAAERAVGAVYTKGQLRSDVLADDVATARSRITKSLQTERLLSAAEGTLAASLAQEVARQPNQIVDDRATDRSRRQARTQEHKVFRLFERGDLLVRAGDPLTPQKWLLLQDMQLVTPQLELRLTLVRLALSIMLVGLAVGYLSLFHGGLISRPSALWLVAMLPLLFLALFRVSLRVPYADFTMVPLAATAAMLLTILLDARIGMVIGFLIATVCALMARAELGLFLTATVSSFIGALSVSNITSRGQLVRAAILLVVSNLILAGIFALLGERASDEMYSVMAWHAAAGLFSVFATAGMAMLLERPFGITSHLRLLELLSPDEKVMQKLQTEAPGTYTHSLMVATLSEAAGKAVGADALLCRVGALYHDIGKLRRPHCFVENQSGDNIHDRLSPQLSALVILAHVKDGLELGRALHLPQPVMDIIAQHHGKTLITYFYQRALNLAAIGPGGSDVGLPVDAGAEPQECNPQNGHGSAGTRGPAPSADEAQFRYPGPLPQSKEAAIVMLADTIEASSRSLADPNPERLGLHIKTMLARRLQEGELAECELTLRDLGTIEDTFIHILRGVLHHRIEYPDPKRELTVAAAGDAWVREALSDHHETPSTERKDTPPWRAAAERPVRDRRQRRRRADRRATVTPVDDAVAIAEDETETAPNEMESVEIHLGNGNGRPPVEPFGKGLKGGPQPEPIAPNGFEPHDVPESKALTSTHGQR